MGAIPSTIEVEWELEEPDERRRAYEAEVQRLTKELVRCGALRVVLFGSRARGEAGPSSDADLLVVMPSQTGRPPTMSELADLYEALAPRGVDLFVVTPQSLETLRETSAFVREALREGQVLHGR
jgi:predicted nucleotidyltransferase